MDNNNPSLMKIIVSKNILDFESKQDYKYKTLRNELYSKYKIDKNHSIICIDLKNIFIINEEKNFEEWKKNRKYLGNYFMIVSEQQINDKKNIDNLNKRIKNYCLIEEFNNLDNMINNKKNEINGLEETVKMLNDEIKNILSLKKLKDEIEKLEKKKEEIDKIIEYNENKIKKMSDNINIKSKENDEIINKNKELKKIFEMNQKKIEFIENSINKNKEYTNITEEIKKKFNNQIQLIIESYENKINEIKNNLIIKCEEYIKEIKEKEEKRKKIFQSWEDKTKEFKEFFHSKQISHGINCNECCKEIKGIKYECSECDYNLCENCELINFLKQKHLHKFFKIRKPINKRSIENEIKKYINK